MLDQLAGKMLTRPDVASSLLAAAVDAVRKHGGKVSMPPKLEVHDDIGAYLMRDKPSKK